MQLKNINDYVDEVASKFPELPKSEVKRILVYGWKMVLQYVSAGNDVYVVKHSDFFFIGRLVGDALSNFQKYCFKLSRRIQYMFKRTKSQWDGYYYFARSESQYKQYLEQSRKKYKVFEHVKLFKLLEELKVRDYKSPYIFRLSEDKTAWMEKYYEEIKTDKAELIIQRDPLSMEDVMTSKNKYKYIQ